MMFHVEQQSRELRGILVRIADALGVHLDPAALALTQAHLEGVLAWNATTSLARFGELEELVLRHAAEGWMASWLIPPRPPSRALRVLDIGSGGGFPALPIHVLRPDVEMTLVEPRGRKAAFLRSIARLHPAPQPTVVDVRLEDLPQGTAWDVVTFRGLHLGPGDVNARLAEGGLVLRFPGPADADAASWQEAGFNRLRSQRLPTEPLAVEAWTKVR